MYRQNTNLDFTGQKISVGLDLHKKSWKVVIYTDHGHFKSFRQPPDPGKLVAYLQRNFPGAHYRAAYEAGGFGFWAQRSLQQMGVDCIVVNPGDVPTTDKQKRTKTDRVDAAKLARELHVNHLTPIYVPDQKAVNDRLLLRTRRTLVKNRTQTKNRIKSILTFFGIAVPEENGPYWSNPFKEWLWQLELPEASGTASLRTQLQLLADTQARLDAVNKQLRQLSKNPPYKRLTQLLCSIPGIGPLSAIALILELIDIRRFRNLDKLCSYVGLIPDTAASGETETTKGITQRSNRYLKNLIVEAAWVAVTKDPAMMQTFNRLSQRMAKQKAIIRIARKLLARIRFVWINNRPYQSRITN